MAPQTKIPCFAAKDSQGKLERWEYEPQPLQAGDIGARVNKFVVQRNMFSAA